MMEDVKKYGFRMLKLLGLLVLVVSPFWIVYKLICRFRD